MNKNVVINLLGTQLDRGFKPDRWKRWRPSVSICQQEDFPVGRYHLLYQENCRELAELVIADIKQVSPETEVVPEIVAFRDPWDFQEVYGQLYDYSRRYHFQPDREDYYIHITTGTHVAQICLFLLTESHHLPGKLLQTSPSRIPGGVHFVIDLDLSKYDQLSMRFRQASGDDVSFLKSGIATRNARFNSLIETIERVAVRSTEPILLTGPTGAGKSRLARKIFELKKLNHQLTGSLVELNCATLRGDGAMSALFGHEKGAFTGAVSARPGLLVEANQGILFLDEIGELGLDEQAMLLRAVEEKTFLPLGADRERHSSFQLICGTNRNLRVEVAAGRFREDLLARINLWTFQLPGLSERREDIEPNLDYELEEFSRKTGQMVSFNQEARNEFLRFAVSPDAYWLANFRDLNAAVTRLSTLATGGRITPELVTAEIERLMAAWKSDNTSENDDPDLSELLGTNYGTRFDQFDLAQLTEVVKICRTSKSLSEAGRQLFAVSRQNKRTANDADRLRKYLAGFSLTWADLGKQ